MKFMFNVSVGLTAVALMACSQVGGSDDGAGGAGAGATGATSGSTGGQTSSSSTGGPTSTGSETTTSSTASTGTGMGGGSECGSLADFWACEECECAKNEAGCNTYWELEEDLCYCGASAPCASACANACTMDAEDAACDACAEGLDDTCFDATSTQCEADNNCGTYFSAVELSCAALPDGG